MCGRVSTKHRGAEGVYTSEAIRVQAGVCDGRL